MGKRIAIAAVGTHGDIRPFLALALALRQAGHEPVIGSTDDFRAYVEGFGIEFYALGGDMKALLGRSSIDKAMQKSLLLYGIPAAIEGMELHAGTSAGIWPFAKGADALVCHMNTTFGFDVGHRLGIPVIMTVLQPLPPTKAFPYCAYTGPDLPPAFNRATYGVLNLQQTYYDLPRWFLRPRLLRRLPVFPTGFARGGDGRRLPILHAYSPAIVPRPGDWPAGDVVTGQWTFDEHPDWQPEPGLTRFLAAGPQPIYIGFGSMAFGAERNAHLVREALALWGGRVLLARGWGGITGDTMPPNAYLIDKAPHSRLFRLVRGVVHHGGAGTTFAGLEAGRPTFVVPQFFDQGFWGRRVHALGCGPAPVHLRKLTPQILADALYDLSRNTAYELAAETLSQKLRAENGLVMAVERIEQIVASFPRS